MVLKDRRIGQRIFPVLLLFLFLFLFEPFGLYPQESRLEDIMKGEMDTFEPSVYHDEIRLEIEGVKEDLDKDLSRLNGEIEDIKFQIIKSDDPADREKLMSILSDLEKKLLSLVSSALEDIGDLRVKDAEMKIAESVESPPPAPSTSSPLSDRILLASSGAFDLFGPETEIGGYLKARINADISKDNDYEDLFEVHPKAFIKLKHPISDRLSIFVSASASYDYYTGGYTHYNHEIELDEAYLDIFFDKFDLRIGNQIVTWGMTDIVNPTDNINPMDITKFITGEVDENKMPIFAAKLDYYYKNTTAEFVLIPFFEEHRYQLWDTDWAFYRPGILGEYAGGMFPWAGLLDEESMNLISSVSYEVTSPITPDESPENFQGGVRISSKIRGWDFSVSYLNTLDKYPTVYLSEDLRDAIENDTVESYIMGLTPQELSQILRLEYERYHVIGFDFATTYGKYGFRGEMGLFLNRFTYTDELVPIKKDYIEYVIGVDRTFGDNLYVNLQFIQKIILDYKKEIIEDEIQNSATLYAYDKFFNEKLIPEVRLYYNINDGDFYVTPKLTYKYTDTLEFSLGLNILEGDPYTIFGYFTNNDQAFFEVKYYF